MIKTRQTPWLAGFAAVSAACIISFLFSDTSSVGRPSVSQPDALLAANTDQDRLVTLHEVRQMLDGHFARLDIDKDGMINPDEYAGRHVNLFMVIDANANRKLSPEEIRLYNLKVHNMRGHNMKRDNVTRSLLYRTTYKD